MRAHVWTAIALLVLAPMILRAQRVHGVLRDSTSAEPLSGAVVSVVDSSGAVTARSVADGAGTFALDAGPRTARLRFIRIGYAPTELQLPGGRSPGDASVNVFMLRIPPILSTVKVSGSELC